MTLATHGRFASTIAALALVGCSLVSPTPHPPRTFDTGIPSSTPHPPRTIDTGIAVTFVQHESVPAGIITPDAAVEQLRRERTAFPRPPDVVAYGVATCPDDEPLCFRRVHPARGGPTEVVLLQWHQRAEGPFGTFFLDARTGEILAASGGVSE